MGEDAIDQEVVLVGEATLLLGFGQSVDVLLELSLGFHVFGR